LARFVDAAAACRGHRPRHRIAKQALDTRHPAIRETLRGIGRTHGEPAYRSTALTTEEIGRLVEVCSDDLAGLRDRALLLLVGFAGALRCSDNELVRLDVADVRPTVAGSGLMIPRSKTDAEGEGAEAGIARGTREETCPVRALRTWVQAGKISDGPVFRRVTQWGPSGPSAFIRILVRRAAAAGIKGTRLEPVTPHGMRPASSLQLTADEEIMEHTSHRSLTTVCTYVRRAKLGSASPSGKLGL
jgi:integrase